MFLDKLIEAAREFPHRQEDEIIEIAEKRVEREKNAPVVRGNLYVKEFSHFDKNGKPVFRWANWGGI